ncbi:hypothetical protein AALP_AAs59482U000200 [Arabis alpina]|uniref:DUF1985 domain-containing protein n=1 Tax=Arabis alpina TaxID=50452 RepID=A0A087FX73_ARAAL|nr:hypothetical protein AALP_AAs59482U000200 [Arabis alpina]
MEGEAGIETQNWDECLPPRLFATDRYPDARLNIYSRPKILLQIQDMLKGTEELQRIKGSSFEQLWDIPFSRCPISCKLVYALLCRQVLTKKKYELWTVFGGHPLRFSLAEFGYITGLDCGDFPEKYKPNPADEITAADVPYWRNLIGDNLDATLEDIHEMLLSSDDMPGWRRLGLALILLVDGVLIARHQKQRTVPTPKYVAMLEDVEAFMRFPWGRESFLRTVKCMVPTQPQSPPVSKRKKVVREEDPVADLQKKLQQLTVHLEGFPLALQLLALEAIPALLSLTPDPRDLRTLSDTEATKIPKQAILNIEQVRGAENNPKLAVGFLVPLDTHDQWEDEIRARKTTYMEELVRERFVFNKSLWPGGYSLLPLRVYCDKKRGVAPRKSKAHGIATKKNAKLAPRKGRANSKVHCSNRRQRKMDEFLSAPNTNNADLREEFEKFVLDTNVVIKKFEHRIEKLERRAKHRRPTRVGKFSSQRVRLSLRKQARGHLTPIGGIRSPSPSTTESVPVNDEIHVENVKHDAVWSEYGGVDSVIRALDEELSGHEEAAEGRGIPSEMVGESPDFMVVDSTECTGPKNARNSEADKSVIVETSPEVHVILELRKETT